MTGRWAALVLTGGRSRRFACAGGDGAAKPDTADKTAVRLGGRSLLEHALDAVAGADPVVAVGPARPVDTAVRPCWTREEPPGGGPVAALAAGLAAVPTEVALVAVLAADQPGVTTATLRRLHQALSAAAPGTGGALLVDAEGRRQWLTGVWRADGLRARLAERDPAGRALREVFGPLAPVAVPAAPGEAEDVDTPDDLARARARLRRRGEPQANG